MSPECECARNFTLGTIAAYCQTSDLGLRLEVDFVFPLSQQQQQQQEQ